MKKEIVEALEAKFDKKDIKSRQGGFGKKLDYVETYKVIQRMNSVFSGQWSFEVLTPVDKAVIGNDVICHVRVTVPDGEGGILTRDGIGGKKIMGNQALADLVKSACSDGLKKACSTLGVALDLYGPESEDKEEVEEVKAVEDTTNGPAGINQISAITKLLAAKKVDVKKFLAENKITELKELKEGQASKLIVELNGKK